MFKRSIWGLMIFIFISSVTSALPPIGGEPLGITPLVNELSLYRNVDDNGNDRGRTVQIISINSFKIYTEFIFEFTADFNYKMSYAGDYGGARMNEDHYIEMSLVKPVFKMVSLNYQRIYNTFETKPIHQLGVRLSF